MIWQLKTNTCFDIPLSKLTKISIVSHEIIALTFWRGNSWLTYTRRQFWRKNKFCRLWKHACIKVWQFVTQWRHHQNNCSGAPWMLAGATPFYALNYCGWNVFPDRTQLKHHHHHFYPSHYLNPCYILYVHVSTPRPVEKLSCSIQRNKYWQRNWPAKLTEYKILMEKNRAVKKNIFDTFYHWKW